LNGLKTTVNGALRPQQRQTTVSSGWEGKGKKAVSLLMLLVALQLSA
jgi:hypothetical protein